MQKSSKKSFCILGFITGICNGLFGSGGGIIAVPALQKAGVPLKNSHASSLALTLPLSVVSAVFYGLKGNFPLRDVLPLIPFGLAGACIGAWLMKKISNKLLKKIFGAFLIIAGVRMIIS